jgi:glycosyltransferase involved in cell wall biosynthesis
MVSVILPVYNRRNSLRMSARSVLDQSVGDLELIVVDDASTEDIASVVRELGDPRVRYVRHERNRGAAAARNTGLAHAEGRFIAFQDSDDLWLPGKLERHLHLLERAPEEVGAVASGKILYGRDAARSYGIGKVAYSPDAGRSLTLEEDQIRRSLIENRVGLQHALFRRDCLPGTDWFDPAAKANNDWEFTVRLVQRAKVLEEPVPVVVAFLSPDSISRSFRKKAIGMLRIYRKNRAVFARYPEEHGLFLYQLGKILRRAGHPRAGLSCLARSVYIRPRNVLTAVGNTTRSALRRAVPRRPARAR